MKTYLKLVSICFAIVGIAIPQYSLAADTASGAVQDYYKALAAATSPKDLFPFYSKRNLVDKQTDIQSALPAGLGKLAKYMRIGLPKSIKIVTEKVDGEKAKINVCCNGHTAVSVANEALTQMHQSRELLE